MSMLFDEDHMAAERFLTCAYPADQVRAMERPLLERGVPLMRQAAAAAAHVAAAMLRGTPDEMDVDEAHVLLLAGAGDNGGDGLFAAADLARQGAQVVCAAVGRSLHEEGLKAFLEAGGKVMALDPAADIPGAPAPADDDDADDAFYHVIDLYDTSELVIDAMTGIGADGALRGIAARIAEEVGANGTAPRGIARPAGETTGAYPLVLAVDVPSGVSVDDGTLPGAYLPADVTVTFGALKPCALLPPAAHACGRTVLVDFGFDADGAVPAVESTLLQDAARAVRAPRVTDDKYARGVVGLVTGSDSYPGAAVLSATAAARANVGMVRYVGPARAQDMVLNALPEAVLGEGRCQAWVVGSGVPDGDHAAEDDPQREAIRRLLAPYAVSSPAAWPSPDDLRTMDPDDLPDSMEGIMNLMRPAYDAGQELLPPVVVDAGAIDLLPDHVPAQVVITPHAGELARLLRARGEAVDADDVTRDPLEWALCAWEMTGATVLLKGAVTIVVGTVARDVPQVMVCGEAPAWMSTAGSGDVLAGSLGALLAQRSAGGAVPLPQDMARIVAAGAFVHGLAGRLVSRSLQSALTRPAVYDEDDDAFERTLFPALSDERVSPAGPLGRPVIAGDIVAALPDAYGLLLSLYDDRIAGTYDDDLDADDADRNEDDEDDEAGIGIDPRDPVPAPRRGRA
ncbi:carbohydrate kinase [Bifidobacterium sp. DSM 109958]|uniref:Multifunctional fusion protein n=1 Tax=Bifidobacterium moraviense TaxID=2675323 RepID=A0A7Y0F0Z0_9BIFI|nr:carbohydrate kinase [Bifidobacterium sp. DSM 109958]